jgi:cytochrome c peroxidase
LALRRRAARWAGAWAGLALLVLGAALAQGIAGPDGPGDGHGPISPLPAVPPANPARVALGERLFQDPRLSGDGTRSCSSCHDIRSNGASRARRDLTPDGRELFLNTLTVFNAGLNFRLNWEGGFRSLEAHAEGILQNPEIMAADIPTVLRRLAADADMAAAFRTAYGRRPDRPALLDALAAYGRSLLTPDSRFDRWLTGDAAALTAQEQAGYQIFRTVGCTACHQGTNVGGNLFQRHGIFHPLASPEPHLLRVPSLRNVGVTAPYFHDGSAATLEDAVRGMGLAQLNRVFSGQEVDAIAAFLRTLTGTYRGIPLSAPP